MDNNELVTFGDVSDYLLKMILKSTITYFVTDQYKNGSIKSFERKRRRYSGTIRLKVEHADQTRPKQWQKFLRDPKNKTELISFILQDWTSSPRHAPNLFDRVIFFSIESKFYKVTGNEGEVKLLSFDLGLIYNSKKLLNVDFNVL